MNDWRRGLSVAVAIARKDAISELRGRQAAGSTLFFAALVLLLFGFALGPDSRRLADAARVLQCVGIAHALPVAGAAIGKTLDDSIEGKLAP